MERVVTPNRLAQMRVQLTKLQAERLKLGRTISEAASYGGATLSKIPEYAAITETLQLLDERVRKLSEEVAAARTVDPYRLPQDRVSVMSRVHAVDLMTGIQQRYYFGDAAILPKNIEGMPVTQASPIGRALLVKCIGDVAEVILPSGRRELKIIAIETLEEEDTM